jgi:hypothetical protein
MSSGLTIGEMIAIGGMAAGALGGSKGQQSQQTTKQEMDPAMRPFIFGGGGQPGLLAGVQGQMARSTSPERMAQFDMMRQQGAGLVGGAVAGNPFFANYSGGQLRGNINPSMIKNGLPNSYANLHPQAQQAMFPPPAVPAPAPAAAPAPNMTSQPQTLEELLAQMNQQNGGQWNNMPGGM